MDKETLLKKYWNYDSFKPLQEQIIESVLQGNDTLALLPTGGGKSLCYQLPALILKGVTLVISPLIALMEDQVQQLKKKGIKAMYIESGIKSQSLSKQLDNCLYGGFQLIYISPERLQNQEFIERIKAAEIGMIAVDEAHCISEWGHDFRPTYRKIKILKEYFSKVPIIAVTASATPKVIIDIQENLGLKGAHLFKGSFERKNINYQIIPTEDKIGTIERILKHTSGTGIIYCRTRNETEKLSALLHQKNVSNTFFHGGIDSHEKKERLQAWQSGITKIMIATTAFGMGIDKANVRFVIHLSMADSLENYYQETGRAGRDGIASTAYLMVQKGDFQQLKNQFLNNLPDEKTLTKCYKHLCNYLQIAYGDGKDQFYYFPFKDFCETYTLSPKKTLNCLTIFDREGIFRLHLSPKNEIKIHFVASRQTIMNYLQENKPENDLLHYLLRNYQDLVSQKTVVLDIKKIKNSLKQSEVRLQEKFKRLQINNILTLDNIHNDTQLFGLLPREDAYSLRPMLNKVAILNKIKEEKISQMIAFISDGENCKRNALLAYFGEEKKQPCGQCSAEECGPEQPKNTTVDAAILSLLFEAPKTASQLKKTVPFEATQLTNALQRLQEQNKIVRLENQAFRINS